MSKIRSAYQQRERVNNPLSGEPSAVKQEFKKEVNINEIISRMRRGINPPQWMTAATPRYGDFTNMPTSFSEAYALIETAEAAFQSLPLEFRRALDHNPANLEKAPKELYAKFGLLKATEAPTSVEPEAHTSLSGDPVSKGSAGSKTAKKIEVLRTESAD